GYAVSQIRKARGLNKKIVNPQPEARHPPSHFCHVIRGQGSQRLDEFLTEGCMAISDCALVNIPHMRDVHALFHDPGGRLGYRGIFKDETSTEVRFSSVPKGQQPIAYIAFNTDAYKKHCRLHKEYWEWVKNRNQARYSTNIEHGRNYDSKNLMHTFRLLDMAEEIARDHTLSVRRPNPEFLMKIRRGEFEYDTLISMAEEKISTIRDLYLTADLPDAPDRDKAEATLIEIRNRAYHA
ncbi:MAG: nucleotidyltransferase, partial [Verrucomicrobiales bacterium]